MMAACEHRNNADAWLGGIIAIWIISGLSTSAAAGVAFAGHGTAFLFSMGAAWLFALPALLYFVRRRRYHLREAALLDAMSEP